MADVEAPMTDTPAPDDDCKEEEEKEKKEEEEEEEKEEDDDDQPQARIYLEEFCVGQVLIRLIPRIAWPTDWAEFVDVIEAVYYLVGWTMNFEKRWEKYSMRSI